MDDAKAVAFYLDNLENNRDPALRISYERDLTGNLLSRCCATGKTDLVRLITNYMESRGLQVRI